MIKILIKALLLVIIILSIYFIVNPSACTNLIAGRVVNPTEEDLPYPAEEKHRSELLVPQGDSALQKDTAQEAGVYDTNTMQENANTQSSLTQEETDYAIANRYVELEREYAAKGQDTQASAKEIAYIVMDDFELTPKEWEAFLQRATETNLFEKVREENK